MTDATADTSDPPEAAGRRPGRRKLLIAAAGLTVLALLVGLWAALGVSGLSALVSGTPKHATEKAVSADAAAPAMLDLGEMLANISGSSATGTPTTRFLKIGLEMVYTASPENEALMKQKQPFLRDAILTYLRQLSEDDLRGSDGLLLLKAELLKRARAVVGNDAPQEFLISELVMQ